MRTLSATLTAAQKARSRHPLFKLTFSKAGEDDVVIQQDRIRYAAGEEGHDNQVADFLFDNSAGYFTSLDLKGWAAVVQRGLTTTADAEYDSMPPMKVLGQNLTSHPGSLRCAMSLIGIPNLLKLDKASKDYFGHWSNTKTVKALFTEIMDGNAVDTTLTEQQTTTDDFLTLPISLGTTDTAAAVKTTAAAGATALALNALGTGAINKGSTLTIAGDTTVYTVKYTVAIAANEATVTLEEGLEREAAATAVVTLAAATGTHTYVGVALTITNRTVTKISFYLKKVGTPGGNITIRIDQDNGGSTLATKTLAVSSLTTSGAWYEVTLDTPLLVDERVWLAAVYTSGDTSNYVCIGTNSTALKPNEALVVQQDAYSDQPDDLATYPAYVHYDEWEDMSQSCAYKYKYTAGTADTNGVDCFEHCTAYEVVYDSEDSLIDTFAPADTFDIYEGMTRLEAGDKLLSYTGCRRRFKADGKIHVFVPTISGTTYDYEYALNVDGTHNMFAKSVRNALVIPNKITVHSFPSDDDQYTGSATDATSYALLPKEEFVRVRATSNAQCQSIAEAMIAQAQMNSQRGSASVPLNLGAEIYDYVKVTDSRQSDSRTGNIGTIRWQYDPHKELNMDFSFGVHVVSPIKGTPSPPVYTPLVTTPLESFRDDVGDRLLEQNDYNLAVKEKFDGNDAVLGRILDYVKGLVTDPVTADSITEALEGYLKNLVEDTTPQLGGDLDINGHVINPMNVAPYTKIASGGGAAGDLGFYVPNTAVNDFVLAAWFAKGDTPAFNMNSLKIVALADPTADQGAATKIYVDGGDFVTVASANIKHSNDAVKNTGSATYAKLKEIEVGMRLAGVRVYFDLTCGSGTAFARLYKNGVAIGTERSMGVGGPTTYYDDITSIVIGDLLQIYAYSFEGLGNTIITNMRLAFDIAPDATNQDP